ncbi:MAG TPA: nucleotidyltransferase family protein [Chromatiales bacterium]|nr:nucleotidyltransferase family protein [Chromatiales bacterium]
MVLAAGRGQRMQPLTDVLPKPLLEVGSSRLIDFPLQTLAQAGINQVVINLAWLGAQIREYVGDGSRYGLSVSFSDEGASALETGGGIFHALPLLGDAPFWVLNADVYSEYPLRARTLSDGMLAHLVLVPNPAHHPGGDFTLSGDRVGLGSGPRYTYSGWAVLSPALFEGCTAGKFPLAPLLVAAIEQGWVSGELFEGYWMDVGTPKRLERLRQHRPKG